MPMFVTAAWKTKGHMAHNGLYSKVLFWNRWRKILEGQPAYPGSPGNGH